MQKKLPDLKVRVDDEMRSAIKDEVNKRKETNPESASVSSVVRDAIRKLLYPVDLPKSQGNLDLPHPVLLVTPFESTAPRKKNAIKSHG